MANKTKAAGWDRGEVNVKLTQRRLALLRALLRDDCGATTPTQAIDIALEAAARSASREDDDAKLLDAAERGFAQTKSDVARLEDSVSRLASQVERLCALISEVASSDD